MRIRLLPSSFAEGHEFLTTFLVGDSVAIDAGSLGFSATLTEQRRIRHVFLSHCHIDHIAGLPSFLENVYTGDGECATIHASEATLKVLQEDVFNDRIWPDFIRLSKEHPPFLKLEPLQEGQTVDIDGVRITPISVDHIVPTFGFLVEEEGNAVAIATDSGPTRELWEQANELPGLQAVFLDASFPESLTPLAIGSKHLTPSLLAEEVKKLARAVRVLAVHIKATHREQVIRELEALEMPGLEIAVPGQQYEFE